MSKEDTLSVMLLSSALSMIYPINVIPVIQSIIELWKNRDYAFVIGLIASLILGFIRSPLICGLSIAGLAVAYHVMRRVRISIGLGPLWILTVLSLAAIYYSASSWGVINYINSLRAWWEGSNNFIPPAYLTLAFTSASVAYSLLANSDSRGFISKINNYLRSNLGALPVLAFMTSLVIAAVYVANGYRESANKLAELAYYFLVLGTALQVYSAVKLRGGG